MSSQGVSSDNNPPSLSKTCEIPGFLFRTWTDKSNGTNSPTLFAPALTDINIKARAHHNTIKYDGKRGLLRCQLTKALGGTKELPYNPFVFVTSSLLYAIQHVIDKISKGHTNVHITCIDIRTARTSEGKKVEFKSVVGLMRELGMKDLVAYRTQQVRDYSDVYVTTDTILPGLGSRTVPFKTLKDEGLFRFLPELQENIGLPKPGLETPVQDLRKYWFRSTQDLGLEEITFAAKLASTFKHPGVLDDPTVPSHLIAWFLALRSQTVGGKTLALWCESYTEPYESLNTLDFPFLKSGVKEVDRFEELYCMLRTRLLVPSTLQRLSNSISSKSIDVKKYKYRAFKARKRQKRKAEKMDDADVQPKKKRVRESGANDEARKTATAATGDIANPIVITEQRTE